MLNIVAADGNNGVIYLNSKIPRSRTNSFSIINQKKTNMMIMIGTKT